MRALLAVLLVACTSSAPPPVAAPQAPPAVAPVVAPVPGAPSITKEEVITQSHAMLDAYDRGDVAAVEPLLSERLLHFEGGKPSTRTEELDQLKKRKKDAATIGKRTWSDEHVQVSLDDAVFIGKATEEQGGNDSHGGGFRYVGWYTLHWAREATGWKVRLWTWQRSGHARDHWNDVYRNNVGFEKQPNRLLVEIAKGLKPGTALDLTMGQGRNVLHLAATGWKATGIDIAEEGVRLAREEASKRKLELTTIVADIDRWDFGKEKWDLITMIYPGPFHQAWWEKAKVGLKKGGVFVLEFFAGDPDHPEGGGYTQAELAKAFGDGFTILRNDQVEDRPDWALDHAKLVRFVAKKNK
jgi:SAM-dependent methyltransferase